MAFMGERVNDARTVTWDASTASNEIQIQPGSISSIYLPAGFVGTQLFFKAQEPSGSFVDVYYDGTILQVGVSAGRRNVLPPELLAVNGMVKFISSATETVTATLHLVR